LTSGVGFMNLNFELYAMRYTVYVKFHGRGNIQVNGKEWIRTIEASVNTIPFQRTNEDKWYSTFRVDLSLQKQYHNDLTLKGGDRFPLWADYIGNAAMFTGICFIAAFLVWIPFSLIYERVKRKLRG